MGSFLIHIVLCYNMLMNDTTFDFEERTYVNPQTGLDERLQFIDTLRDVAAQNTAQINQNTYNLGSQVPSNVGGLTGSEGLWKAQYQTPQLNAQVANLRATAQQDAFNQAMQNVSDIESNRLRQAWRGYYARKKAQEDADRAAAKAALGKGVNQIKTPESVGAGGTVRTNAPGTSTVWTGQYDADGNPVIGVYDTASAMAGATAPLETYAQGQRATEYQSDNNIGQYATEAGIMGGLLSSANPFWQSILLGSAALQNLFGGNK